MKTMTAGNLKNKTGESVKVASKVPLRSLEESWKDIKDTIRQTKPKFNNAKEAMNQTRRLFKRGGFKS